MRKTKRKTIAWILVAGIFIGTATSAVAERHIRLFANGSEVQTDSPPLIVNERVMIPIRAAAEILGKNVQWNAQTSKVTIEDQEVLLTQYSKGNQKVKMWGNKVNGDYWGMKITIGDITRNFPFWHNVGNPSYAPRILLEDLNQDGKDELLVILTTGYGTGLKDEEAYIFDSESFNEIPLEDWQTYALKHVVPGRVTEEGARIRIDNVETSIPHHIPAEEFKGDQPQWWYDSPAYGQVIRYEVRQNALYAVLPLWYSPAHSAGQLEIRFSYQDRFFQGKSIEYKEE
ncbi:copper amine oxidase N-terminal domain-containing protein [Paenibacillus nasutitermitis]|uniref:Copper amine oxidase-like N-terminal domain-containing protein n=1 Tax=Paenibacillus nasutitermitis TaxID=1652958 RepID=A0A917DY09_9BACL|nr:copper amine oxidase N-terminal domain-containing protein [Paenibacillus nasutitermitis]GGD78354.1 hypothetical protein GCM10010911_40480 [Paenibacillus nasutitermitis]